MTQPNRKGRLNNMKNKKWKPIAALALAVSVCAIFTMTGCSSASADTGVSSAAVLSSGSSQSGTSTVSGTGIVNGEELFTERDLEQTPDLSEAETITLTDETEIDIIITLGDGAAAAKAWGCDLTYEYVKINGDYRT